MRAHARKHLRGHFRRRAQKRAPILAEGHGGEHRQIAVFPSSQQRRLRLAQVGHGLDQHHIAAGGGNGAHLLGEQVVSLFEAHGSHGFQQRTRRTDIAGDVRGAGGTSAFGSRTIHVLDACGTFQLQSVGTERVRGDDLGSRIDIGLMNGRDVVRMREVEQLGDLPSIGKAPLLQLRAHGPVHHQEVLPEQRSFQMPVFDGKSRQIGLGQLCRLRPTAGQLLVRAHAISHGR